MDKGYITARCLLHEQRDLSYHEYVIDLETRTIAMYFRSV